MNIEDKKQQLTAILHELTGKLGYTCDVALMERSSQTDNGFHIATLRSDTDISLLIGKNGQNLNALEHIVRLLMHHKSDDTPLDFIIDINNYRKSRTDFLIQLAHEVARRVIQNQRAEALIPMSSYERRLIHMELATHNDIATESIGQEPMRRVVIKPETIVF